MTVKILGICGSVRKDSGTETAVKEALTAASQIDADVATEYISLRNKKIKMCMHCDNCFKNKSLCAIQDDFQEIQEAFLNADGYIVGSPVYNMNITPVLNAFMSRVRPTYLVYPGHFTGRAGGSLVVGGGRNSGQEIATLIIHGFFQTYEILCCGGSLHEPGGAMLWSKDGSPAGARLDAQGLEGARRLGKRIAQTAAILKHGMEKMEQDGRKIYKTEQWFEY